MILYPKRKIQNSNKLQKKDEEKKKNQGKNKRPNAGTFVTEEGGNILNTGIQDGLMYHPSQKETRHVYSQILYVVQNHIGDVDLNILKAGTDEVLAILKTDDMKDKDRRSSIEAILQNKIADETFNTLTVLAAKIIDYNPVDLTHADQGEEILEIDVDIEKEAEESSDDEDGIYVKDPEIEENKILEGKNQGENENMSDEEEKVLQVGKEDALWIEKQLQGFIKNQSRAKELFTILNFDKPEE